MTAGEAGGDDPRLVSLRDGRQSPAALDICRGVVRLLASHGLASVAELPLPNGRRADVVGLSDSGGIWIVEIKSSIEDLRADGKWPEYRDYSDQLFFAVRPDFPLSALPEDTGLILADRYGGEIIRPSQEARLSGARRKSMMVRFARAAALRLTALADPEMMSSG
ncbi:MAG TPA: MmcB family DNA repair protein [Hyphomicrobiaceae bacterium]|nr:MmcB family DNA repair protein [Hyphomicrobiaceae bacterium]